MAVHAAAAVAEAIKASGAIVSMPGRAEVLEARSIWIPG